MNTSYFLKAKFSMKIFVSLCFLFILAAWSVQAQADPAQIKLYKAAFPSAKLKCIDCHVSEKPKKDDGEHELNAYGKKVLATAEEPTADTYKTVGPIEEFKE